ncbi:MAG: CBS domain-containing protein [Halobacteriovoraceae bacterium]|nr:CBS domain-containing protein [Halobacteriovoraceae bacterium]
MEYDIEEEEQIAKEQDRDGTCLSSEIFINKIKEITTPPVIAFDENTLLGEIVPVMQKKHIGSVVLTKNKVLSGILTERDLLMKVLGKHEDWKTKKALEFMTVDPQSLRKEDEIAYILNNMHVGGYRHIPIVDSSDVPISMVSIKDVMSWILDYFPDEITNMTGEPYRGESKRESA